MTKRLRPTAKFLSDAEQMLEHDPRYLQYKAIFPKIAEIEWSHMITITTAIPLTDEIFATRVCREFKKRLYRELYGRHRVRSEKVKFCFLIEKHKEQFKAKPKLHIHALVTRPSVARILIHDCSLLPYVDLNQNHTFLSKSYKSVLEEVLQNIKNASFIKERLKLDQIDITKVTSSEGVADYLLKEFRESFPYIDWENSDLSWVPYP